MQITTEPGERATESVPVPQVKIKSGPSLVWLIPLITVIIGGWLIFKTVSEQGPKITITFKTAEGIEAGKTKIKYKDIDIGVVDSLHFSEDFSHIILSASMDITARAFLGRDTRFWVVKPRLTLREVSNLSTLVSGAYIEIEPGQGALQTRFVGLEEPPVIKADTEGTKIVLLTQKLGSIDTGSPIYYQGILAGEILGWELGNDRKSIFVHAFIKAPYDELVQSSTRFWNVSGLNVSVGSQGVNVQTESVQSLLYGGVSFETPETLEPGREDVKTLVFTLYDDYQSILEQSFTKKITFVLFFDGSVRGLNIGAPVEFKGIKVGSVVDIRLEYDDRDASFRIPVLIELEPERIIDRGDGEVQSPYDTLNRLVEKGLRATLKSGSLITGQLFVELDMHPGTDPELSGKAGPIPELPTIPPELEQMATSAKRILSKMEKIDWEGISEELLQTLEGANKLAKGANELIAEPQLMDAVYALKDSLHQFQSILTKVERHIEPIAVNLERAIGAGYEALEKAQATLELMDSALKPDAPLQYRFNELAEELAEAARSIRILMDMLERDPNAIVFGKSISGEK